MFRQIPRRLDTKVTVIPSTDITQSFRLAGSRSTASSMGRTFTRSPHRRHQTTRLPMASLSTLDLSIRPTIAFDPTGQGRERGVPAIFQLSPNGGGVAAARMARRGLGRAAVCSGEWAWTNLRYARRTAGCDSPPVPPRVVVTVPQPLGFFGGSPGVVVHAPGREHGQHEYEVERHEHHEYEVERREHHDNGKHNGWYKHGKGEQ